MVCPRTFNELPQASYSVALNERGVPWMSTIQGLELLNQGPHPRCTFFLTPFSLQSTGQPPHSCSAVICFSHSHISSASVSSDCVRIFFDTALSQKTMPQGKCLKWSRSLFTSLRAGPAQCVPERDLVIWVLVHTLGSRLLISHFWQSCPHIFHKDYEWKVGDQNSYSCDKNVYDH